VRGRESENGDEDDREGHESEDCDAYGQQQGNRTRDGGGPKTYR
jgi:hypothetical protein